MTEKTASSQAAWALLMEGVTRSRLESHRIQLLVDRAMLIIGESDQEEHIHQVGGDIIQALPKRLDALNLALDRTSLALSKMGEDFLDSRLPLSDKTLVDEAISAAFGSAKPKHSMVDRVAVRYLQGDLNPPLGKPGGPCQVVKRIEMQVTNPSVQHDLIDEIEYGDQFSNSDASKVYGPDIELVGGAFRKMQLSSHAQYRMDLRGLTVTTLQRSLMALSTEMKRDKRLEADVLSGEPFRWDDQQRGFTVVLAAESSDMVRIITLFPKGTPDPKPPGEGGCVTGAQKMLFRDYSRLSKPEQLDFIKKTLLAAGYRQYAKNPDRVYWEIVNDDEKVGPTTDMGDYVSDLAGDWDDE